MFLSLEKLFYKDPQKQQLPQRGVTDANKTEQKGGKSICLAQIWGAAS